MLSDQTIADVRMHTDIVAVVGEYVRLKRAGASWKGLCPFHNEKTPSFHVTPSKQFFHCFGCGASGDAIGFVMKLDGLTFPEALRRLAERAGIPIAEEDPREAAEARQVKQQKDRLVHAMEVAVDFYERMLREHALGHMAREELQRRGVTDETAKSFHLGYAPSGWDALSRELAAQGVSPADAETVGLLSPRKSGDGHYDRFRHRLMFPVHDDRGRFVAFSGRLLPTPPGEKEPEEPGAKYYNSTETPLYKKGETLFGLWNGRVALRRTGLALMCEGNFDLVMLHQHGFAHSVAPMGTALTSQQARVLRRFVETVVLVFDADNAGKKAVRAAQPILAEVGLSARVVTLPPGADPDSFLRERGADALAALVDRAPNIIDYLIDEAADLSAGDAQAKARAIPYLGNLLRSVENEVERALYADRIAQRFEITDRGALQRELRKATRSSPSSPRDRGSPEKEGNDRGPTDQVRDGKESGGKEGEKRVVPPVLEGAIVGAILDAPGLLETPEANEAEDLLTKADLRAIFPAARKSVTPSGLDGSGLLSLIPDNTFRVWIEERLSLTEHDTESAAKVLRDGIHRLRMAKLQGELSLAKSEVLAARRTGDDASASTRQQRVDEIHRAISLLQSGKR